MSNGKTVTEKLAQLSLDSTALVLDELWYLVPLEWVATDCSEPLDCSALGGDDSEAGQVQADLVLDKDFVMLHETTLARRVAERGRVAAAPLFPRRVVSSSESLPYVDCWPRTLRALRVAFGVDLLAGSAEEEDSISRGGGGGGSVEQKHTDSDDAADTADASDAPALLYALPSVAARSGALCVPRKASFTDVVKIICAHFGIESASGHEVYRRRQASAVENAPPPPLSDWDSWALLAADEGMQWLATADATSALLLVERTLEVGSRLDVLDDSSVWYEAEVVALEAAESPLGAPRVRVHFRAWHSTEFNETIAADSDRLRPPWSKLAPFRETMKAGDHVDYLWKGSGDGDESEGRGLWYPCEVRGVDGSSCSLVEVHPRDLSRAKSIEERCAEVSSFIYRYILRELLLTV